jgi:hypothetical protein
MKNFFPEFTSSFVVSLLLRRQRSRQNIVGFCAQARDYEVGLRASHTVQRLDVTPNIRREYMIGLADGLNVHSSEAVSQRSRKAEHRKCNVSHLRLGTGLVSENAFGERRPPEDGWPRTLGPGDSL